MITNFLDGGKIKNKFNKMKITCPEIVHSMFIENWEIRYGYILCTCRWENITLGYIHARRKELVLVIIQKYLWRPPYVLH